MNKVSKMPNKLIRKFKFNLAIMYIYFLYLSKYDWYQIWFNCFGKVIFLNGVSSSGKTTLVSFYIQLGFKYIGLDDFYDSTLIDLLSKKVELSFLNSKDLLKLVRGYKIDMNSYNENQRNKIADLEQFVLGLFVQKRLPNKKEIFCKLFEQVKKNIFSGISVVLDILILNEGILLLKSCFDFYPIRIGLVYCSLADNLERCYMRNLISDKNASIDYRFIVVVLTQFFKFYTIKELTMIRVDELIDFFDKEKTLKILSKAFKLEAQTIKHTRNIRYRYNDFFYNQKSLNSALSSAKSTIETYTNYIKDLPESAVLTNVNHDFKITSVHRKRVMR